LLTTFLPPFRFSAAHSPFFVSFLLLPSQLFLISRCLTTISVPFSQHTPLLSTMAAPTPIPPTYTLAQERLLTRQLLRFRSHPVASEHFKRSQFTPHRALEASYLIDEIPAAAKRPDPEYYKARKTEPDFPEEWLQFTTDQLRAVVQRFIRFSDAHIPTWFPSRVIYTATPAALPGLVNSLNVRVSQAPYAGSERIIMKAADIGYSLFNTERSKRALCSLLRNIITNWNRLGMAHLYPPGPIDDNHVAATVDHFISRLGAAFPEIVVQNNEDLEGSEAETTRLTWHNDGQGMEHYVARMGSRIAINKLVRNIHLFLKLESRYIMLTWYSMTSLSQAPGMPHSVPSIPIPTSSHDVKPSPAGATPCSS
jgi:hypothetical protein